MHQRHQHMQAGSPSWSIRSSGHALLTVLGLLSFLTMPRREDPIFDIPTASLVVVFPGADPEVVEASRQARCTQSDLCTQLAEASILTQTSPAAYGSLYEEQ